MDEPGLFEKEGMMKKINVGFIGNGKSTNRYHAPFLLDRPETFSIRKIYSRDNAHDAWEEIEGVEYVPDVNDVLNDPQIDLVVVATRHDTHYEFARQAIEAGKNTLVEKPFVMREAQARELFELAKEKGVLLQGYQNRRFDSDFLTLQNVIESGKLGTLMEVESHYDYYRPEIPEGISTYSRESSYVFGHACHTIDQVLALFGSPKRAVYDVRSLLGKGRMNDYFDIDFFYEEPLKVSIKSSYFRVKGRPKFVAYGTKGMFIKEEEDRQEADLKRFYLPCGHPDFGKDGPQDYGTLIYYDDEGKYHEEKVVSVDGSYAMFYDALYETLVNKKAPLVRPEQTIELVRYLEAACESLEKSAGR